MEKSLLSQLTGEMPLFKIIDFLIENKNLDLKENINIKKAIDLIES